MWASCNGNEDVVRLLIRHRAHEPYLVASETPHDNQDEKIDDFYGEVEKDPFVPPKDASKLGRYTPLHWASFKGHKKVAWLLLKAGLSPTEIDMYGNTSVHHSSSNENGIEILKCFLS
jgi:ankyrin repeat protein